MQREKGKRGEREVVNLARAYGLDAVRTWETAQGANPECDVCIQGEPYQVKFRRSFKFLYDALHGVKGVFLKQNGGEWLIVLRAKDYLSNFN
jgi:Holliday junction resolvase